MRTRRVVLREGRDSVGAMPRRRDLALFVALALGVTVFGAYFGANTVRAAVMGTEFLPVGTMRAAMLGTIVPLALALLKAHWYAHEAAVEHHRKTVGWRRAARRWRASVARAATRLAEHRGVRMHVIARAAYVGSTEDVSAERVVLAALDRDLPIEALRSPALPDALRADRVVAAAESLIRSAS